jgi:ABC-type multidrug transport system ATPase subunit
MYICPKGSYCPQGAIRATKCAWLEVCPEGTVRGIKIGNYVIFAFVLFALFLLYQIKAYLERREMQLRKIEEAQAEAASMESTATTSLKENVDPKTRLSAEYGVYSSERSPSADSSTASDSRSQTVRSGNNSCAPTRMDIEFKDLGLTLPSGKVILEGVNGSVRAGRVTAIMGPSGAGKTTFLSVLSGKVRKTHGHIYVNGTEEPDGVTRYRSLVGYVPQEDTMIRTMTVYDNLAFSASYRLDSSVSAAERRRRVFDVIKMLGLSHVIESPIGDERTRGISGGQRKRVNVGIELVADPLTLFLDEPTSGLDSSSSLDLCMALRQLAREKNVCVAAVLHQPRYEIFASFDDLLVLGKGGRTVYIGPCDVAIDYFEGMGFRCPPRVNIADFIMDIAAGKVVREGDMEEFNAADLPDLWIEHQALLKEKALADNQRDGTLPSPTSVSVRQSFSRLSQKRASLQNSSSAVHIPSVEQEPKPTRWATFVEVCRDMTSDAKDWLIDNVKELVAGGNKFRNTPGMLGLFFVCFLRAFRMTFTSLGKFMRENALHILVGLFLGTSFRLKNYLGPVPEQMAENLCPLLLQSLCKLPLVDGYQQMAVFISWGLSFAGAASSVATFGATETNYFREVGSGMKTVPYYLAHALADIPRISVAALVFEIAFLGVYETAMDIYDLYAIVWMLYINGWAIGYLITTVFGVALTPLVAVVVTLFYASVLSGFSVKLPDVDPNWKWIYDMSYARWSVEAYYVSEISKYDYFRVEAGYEQFGYSSDSVPSCLGYMFLIACGWHVISCAVMGLSNKAKKK